MKTFKDLKEKDTLRIFSEGMLHYVFVTSSYNAGGMQIISFTFRGKECKLICKHPAQDHTRFNGAEYFSNEEACKNFVINKVAC